MPAAAAAAAAGGGEDEGGAWGDDIDLGLGDGLAGGGLAAGAVEVPVVPGGGAGARFVPPTPGRSEPAQWLANSSVAADHVAAGSFESALTLLNRQIGLVRFGRLREGFLRLHASCITLVPGVPGAPAIVARLRRNALDAPPPRSGALPYTCATLGALVETLKSSYRSFALGKFGDVAEHLDSIFAMVPLTVVASRAEAADVKELLGIAGVYKTATMLEAARKALGGARRCRARVCVRVMGKRVRILHRVGGTTLTPRRARSRRG